MTSFLQSESGILLLRRSDKVGTHRGRWAGVSGYLEPNEVPLQRAKIEVREEVGLDSEHVNLIRAGEPLRAFDEQNESVWVIYPFLFEVQQGNIQLDWEHTEFKWIKPDELGSYETVPKLREAFERVQWDLTSISLIFAGMERGINELSEDRTHGASYLGRRSIEILGEVAKVSAANSTDDLFRDLLCFALRLRRAQPSMATIRNLTGMLLNEIALARTHSVPLSEFRKVVSSLAEKILSFAIESAEDASRHSVALFRNGSRVLTHSYSTTVKRALELAGKSNSGLMAYVTESAPGLEGKRLANELVNLGVSVKLIADSAVSSIISDIDMVLVGADSVLADGSVINKIGTHTIASGAAEHGKPFYVTCESAKLSAQNFLGEAVDFSKELFVVTPAEKITAIVTEEGKFHPGMVEERIRKRVSQLYP